MKKIVCFLTAIFMFTSVCYGETYLKIGLKYGRSAVKECTFESESGFFGYVDSQQVFTADEGKLYVVTDSINTVVTGESQALYYTVSDGVMVEIAPASGEIIKFNGKPYRGSMIISLKDGGITVINCVELESYLKSVVPSEMPSGWHEEALKAQAVCARNYALSNLGKYKSYGFDMDDTISNQVYKGVSSEAESTSKAVEATSGVSLTHGDSLVQTFFYSSGAGTTEDVKDVWGSEIPYLKSVEVPNEEVRSWEKKFTYTEMNERLKNAGLEVGDVKSIEITKRSSTGRVTEVVITGSNGVYTAKKEKARTVFSLNSSLYDIEISGGDALKAPNVTGVKSLPLLGKYIFESLNRKNDITSESTFTFKGKGNGHAVGMSQYGAKALAESGYTFDQILTHFYTGSTVTANQERIIEEVEN